MQNDEPERYFSISEVGRILGYERSTIYSRIKAGRLKAVRLDGVQLGLLAQLGREPSFAELMPAGIQQKVTETHAA